MLRALVVVCLLCSGCGRLGFVDQADGGLTRDGADHGLAADAFVCVPAGHDEDGDGVDDACDVCPHLPGAQIDTDGDRVGDACDPEPGNPRQRIVVFDPFEVLGPPWNAFGGAFVQGGTLRLSATTGTRYITRPYTFGSDLIGVGGTTGNAGSGNRVVAVTMASSSLARFYCELFDNSVDTRLKFTYTFDNVAYMIGDEAVAATQVANGTGRLSLATTKTVARCESSWHDEALMATATIPTIAVDQILLYAENVETSLDYFVQIHTDD